MKVERLLLSSFRSYYANLLLPSGEDLLKITMPINIYILHQSFGPIFWTNFMDNFLDPNILDPNFLNPYFLDPKFLDPNFLNPNLLDQVITLAIKLAYHKIQTKKLPTTEYKVIVAYLKIF